MEAVLPACMSHFKTGRRDSDILGGVTYIPFPGPLRLSTGGVLLSQELLSFVCISFHSPVSHFPFLLHHSRH